MLYTYKVALVRSWWLQLRLGYYLKWNGMSIPCGWKGLIEGRSIRLRLIRYRRMWRDCCFVWDHGLQSVISYQYQSWWRWARVLCLQKVEAIRTGSERIVWLCCTCVILTISFSRIATLRPNRAISINSGRCWLLGSRFLAIIGGVL